MFRKKYESVKQKDFQDCGAACISTVLKQYGTDIPISKIREISGTTESGTNVKGIINCLESFNFQVKAIKTDMEIFKDEKLPYPAIAHIIKDELYLHYVVIHKVMKSKLIISDPAEGIIEISKVEFSKMWTGVIIYMLATDDYVPISEDKNSLVKFSKILLSNKLLVFYIAIATLIAIAFGIGTSFYFQTLIDTLIPDGTLSTLNIVSIGVIVAYIFQTFFETIKTYLLNILGSKLNVHLMLEYYRHVLNLPISFFITRKSGEIISRFMDANKVVNALANATVTVFLDVFMILVVGTVMFFQNSYLFLIAILAVPFYCIIIFTCVKLYEKYNKSELEANAKLNSYIIESLNGIETIKAYQAEKESYRVTNGLLMKYISSMFKNLNIDVSQGFFKKLFNLTNSAIIVWVGATYVINGDLSLGQLITFNTLLAYFAQPIQNIINLQPQMQTAKVAADRLDDIMQIPVEIDEFENNKVRSKSVFEKNIEIRKMTFGYTSQKPCLENISLEINLGEKVALVGKSGSGKSTLAKLIASFCIQDKGEILYSDYNINDIDRRYLRKHVVLVPQSTFFFSGTIYENLVYGLDREVELDEVIEVCKKAAIHDVINELPLRYGTLLEENASNFSGGQRQRLALARALLHEPNILILDESTSSVDSVTEKKIMDELYAMEGLTLITIAHRLGLIQKSHKIFVLEDGKLVEKGIHAALLEKQGKYYEMWNL